MRKTLELMVIYQHQANKVIWTRPALEFFDGRFMPVSILVEQERNLALEKELKNIQDTIDAAKRSPSDDWGA